MIHENSVEFCLDFKYAVTNINFTIKKFDFFLPYANLCKLGDYIGYLNGHYVKISSCFWPWFANTNNDNRTTVRLKIGQ